MSNTFDDDIDLSGLEDEMSLEAEEWIAKMLA